MFITYYQNLFDAVISRKKLILILKPIFLRFRIVPYVFFMSTRPPIFNKLFYDFFYFLNLNIFLLKYFTNKIFILFYFLSEKNTYAINQFIIKLHSSLAPFKTCLFKKYYKHVVQKLCSKN